MQRRWSTARTDDISCKQTHPCRIERCLGILDGHVGKAPVEVFGDRRKAGEPHVNALVAPHPIIQHVEPARQAHDPALPSTQPEDACNCATLCSLNAMLRAFIDEVAFCFPYYEAFRSQESGGKVRVL